MDKFYYSRYGPCIQQFLELKRNLSYKYKDADWVFANFDKFAMDHEETCVGISKELADQWCKMSMNESEKSRYNRIQIIRQFSLFLVHLGHPSHIPKLPRFKSVFTPYIFSIDEVNAIFATCDKLKVTRNNPKALIFIIPALIRLLYGTGIRISEAILLSFEDVNLKNKNLILRNCKNGKDRLVPLSDSLAEVCGDYLKYRNHISTLTHNITDSFFVSPEGTTLKAEMAYKWFRMVLFKTGISHGGRGVGPRLQDFRHTFCVHSLASMAESGMDLYYSLPVLSTYMGHQSLAATDKYVRLTANMYPSIIENANKLCPYLFPEIYKITENETN
jgi:integrase/recombinase XerD